MTLGLTPHDAETRFVLTNKVTTCLGISGENLQRASNAHLHRLQAAAEEEAVKIIARIEFMERQGERKWLAAISAQKRALCHHIKCIKNHQSQSLNIV